MSCLDLGGPAAQVTSATGFKVPAHHPAQAVSELAAAMVCFAADEPLCLQMGLAGQKRVREYYSWEVKGKELSRIYLEIVARQGV